MALIVSPSIIVVLDDSIDTSVFYSLAEEEENGKVKKLISPFSLQCNEFASNYALKNLQHFGFCFKKYPKPHLNLISPPPEQIIL
ncbi:hypothetical protein QLS71_008160 [Mariniflexile litorale]|uniref:Uncharacterized protein n=1 Tax=Mariniflexile litorale TaxID=3045158 RepID=A0AAU7EK55_9FLAO|nr:hypothetical protein [Mariniflexile sp. KMM 9835]MDQ8212794.1 hypothetical protein [Mariniflexile sp. KMM 9835]